MTDFFNASNLIEWGGLLLIIVIIFAETGLLLGLIVPGGETLIFTAGLLVSTNTLSVHILILLILMILSATAGDASGYFIGNKMGASLYKKDDTWYFKKKYLHKAEEYFKNHPKKAIAIGKFLPVIRPFIPVTAGITSMAKPKFFLITSISVAVYISLFLFAGYFLGNRFPQIQDYIHWILPISILVLVVPVLIQIKRNEKS